MGKKGFRPDATEPEATEDSVPVADVISDRWLEHYRAANREITGLYALSYARLVQELGEAVALRLAQALLPQIVMQCQQQANDGFTLEVQRQQILRTQKAEAEELQRLEALQEQQEQLRQQVLPTPARLPLGGPASLDNPWG